MSMRLVILFLILGSVCYIVYKNITDISTLEDFESKIHLYKGNKDKLNAKFNELLSRRLIFNMVTVQHTRSNMENEKYKEFLIEFGEKMKKEIDYYNNFILNHGLTYDNQSKMGTAMLLKVISGGTLDSSDSMNAFVAEINKSES